jgi:hypothetical protein
VSGDRSPFPFAAGDEIEVHPIHRLRVPELARWWRLGIQRARTNNRLTASVPLSQQLRECAPETAMACAGFAFTAVGDSFRSRADVQFVSNGIRRVPLEAVPAPVAVVAPRAGAAGWLGGGFHTCGFAQEPQSPPLRKASRTFPQPGAASPPTLFILHTPPYRSATSRRTCSSARRRSVRREVQMRAEIETGLWLSEALSRFGHV